MKLLLKHAGFSVAFTISLAHAEEKATAPLPHDLSQAIAIHFPHSKLVSQSPRCETRQSGIIQIGAVVRSTDNPSSLYPILAVYDLKHWKITGLQKRIESSHGFMSDFLSEFRTQSVITPEVRCVNFAVDTDVGLKTNGTFVGTNLANHQKDDRHVCFQTSAVYNNWACFWTNTKTQEPALSFVQFNAD